MSKKESYLKLKSFYFHKKIVNVSLIILTLSLLSRNFYIGEPSFMSSLAVYVLLGFLFFNIPFLSLYNSLKKKTFIKSFYGIFGTVLIIFSFLFLSLTDTQFLWFISVPILILGLVLLLIFNNIKKWELNILALTSFIYALFFIFVQSIPSLWYLFQQFSILFTKTLGILIGKPIVLGPSVSGLWMWMAFLFFSIIIFYKSNREKKNFVLNILAMFISWIIYLIILASINFGKSEAINLHYLLFIFLLVPNVLYFSKTKVEFDNFEKWDWQQINYKKIVKNGAVWSAAFLLISVFLITSFLPTDDASNKEEKTILFYGQNMLGDWSVPDYSKYGKQSTGMHGLLPYYLNNSGYNTQIVVKNKTSFMNRNFPTNLSQLYNQSSTVSNNSANSIENISFRSINFTSYCKIIESAQIDHDLLTDVDIFVVINLNKSFSPMESGAIWNLIEQGGSLLVLGDHTDIAGMQRPLNNLLEPVGIRYRFDSAIPIDDNFYWEPCYQLMHNPVSNKIQNLNQIHISVGASLDVNYGSFPMIVGKYGLSDKGDYEHNANLGDYNYQPHEQLGDIILAAGAYYGDGKVMVFGDTSSFQNLAQANSLPLLKGIFGWLAGSQTGAGKNIQIAISLICLLLASVLYFKFKTSKINFTIFPIIICIAIILSAGYNSMVIPETRTKGNIVYLDISHNERFNLESYNNNSLSGAMINFLRNDYLPIILHDFSQEKIENSKLLIFNAPTKKFSYDEVEILKKYMKKGGLIILATGYEDKAASMPLLEEFGLDIYDFPLGPVPYTEQYPKLFQNQTRFVDAWAINKRNSENTETLVAWPDNYSEQYDLITFTKHGTGGLVLIADSQFLHDKNIETLETLWPGNVQFLKNLLDEMQSRGVLK